MLRSAGHRVESAGSGADGIDLARQGAFDVVL
jgi:CheY-like chemotaxis protein